MLSVFDKLILAAFSRYDGKEKTGSS